MCVCVSVIVRAHACLFACLHIGVCRSYFLNVFLSCPLRQRGNGEEGEECVFVCRVQKCVCVFLLFRKHVFFCSERMEEGMCCFFHMQMMSMRVCLYVCIHACTHTHFKE